MTNMTKEIRLYKKELDRLFSENRSDTDWERVKRDLEVRISFYKHERLVHLIVTMSVALMTVVSFAAVSLTVSVQFIALTGLLLGLTAAYLIYYFRLENAVQGIYRYYYNIAEKAAALNIKSNDFPLK